ncbi:MAG: hypothetical protein IJY50_09660 [Clostridia bacterium]|nr:hypothetical protein [Clostridia bacterium]
MENEKKKSFFSRKTDRPDAVAEDTTPTLKFFFKLLGRKLGKLMSLNLMMSVLYIPLIVALIVYFFGDTMPTTESALFAPLLGVSLAGGSPTANLLMGAISRPLDVPVLSSGRLIAILILVVATALTWGWQNVGATYNLRSLIRGDSCFLMSDYFYAIRRNLKQGFFFGLLDFSVIAVLFIDLYYFSALADVFWCGVVYVMMIALAVIYTVMRFYIYHMMITFDLSVKKLLKNALIFVMLGLKRNAMALLGLAIVIGANLALIVPCLSVGFSLPLILPLFYLPALAGFIAGYAAWPVIQQYMIDPYQKNEGEDTNESEDALTPPAIE